MTARSNPGFDPGLTPTPTASLARIGDSALTPRGEDREGGRVKAGSDLGRVPGSNPGQTPGLTRCPTCRGALEVDHAGSVVVGFCPACDLAVLPSTDPRPPSEAPTLPERRDLA